MEKSKEQKILELKALVYDLSAELQARQQQINNINNEIIRLSNEPEKPQEPEKSE